MTRDEEEREATTSDRAKNIASGIRFLTVQNLVNGALGFVFLGVLLRLLSPTDYGLYAGVVLVTGIGTSVASFGLPTAATRFVALMARTEEDSKEISRSILILSLIFTSVVTVGFIALSPALSMYFTRSTGSTWVFAISGAWLFTNTTFGLFQGFLQGMKKYEELSKILMTANLGMVCLTLIGLLGYHSIVVAIVAWIFHGTLVTLWGLAITRKGLGLGEFSRKDTRKFKNVLKYSIPLGVAGILTVATGVADPIVVGGLMDQTSLGAYNVAVSISGGLGMVLFAPLNMAFFPETSSSANDSKELSIGLRLAFRYSLLALLPVSFAIAAVSKQMINLFSGGNPSYLIANLPLQLMAVFFFFIAMQGIPTSLLLSIGRTTQVMLIGIATVIIDLALSIALIPSLGLLGATASRIIVDIIGFIMTIYVTKSYLKGIADVRFYAKVSAISLILLAVLLSLTMYVSDAAYTLIPYGAVGTAVLLLCVRAFRLLNEEDKGYLEHFAPLSMRKWVRRLI